MDALEEAEQALTKAPPPVEIRQHHAQRIWKDRAPLNETDRSAWLVQERDGRGKPASDPTPDGHPDAALESLIAGYRRFRASEWPDEKERFELASKRGQRPHTLVIACSDSRVDPQMIFGAHPGELFVIRNVASLVPPFENDSAHHGTSAAIEFAVRILEVGRIFVLGHEMCGGIGLLLDQPPQGKFDFAVRWMDLATDAKLSAEIFASPETRRKACEEAAVRLSLANLLTFPWLAEAVRAGTLSLHGGYFDIGRGLLLLMGHDGKFTPAEHAG